MTGLIVAIDTTDLLRAQLLVSLLEPHVDMFKIGTEFFAAHGPDGVRRLGLVGKPYMLDLKLHDIPTTVANTVTALLPLWPHFLTVHAAGGADMMGSAMVATANGVTDGIVSFRPKILAVTTLTSRHTISDFHELAVNTAINANADGVVCPVQWVSTIRDRLANRAIVCPGIRLPGARDNDHLRVATPSYAAGVGVDWIVVGRPITQAADPVEAAKAIMQELK